MSEIDVQPEVPSITPKAGWSTSQGQLTGIFTIVCLILALFGYKYTPDQLSSWVDLLNHWAETLGPIIAAVTSIAVYTISRGKTYSNAMNATAHVQAAVLANPPILATSGTLEPAHFGSFPIGGLIGGHDWKDPERYGNLLHVAAELGVPGATQADTINQQLHPVDLVHGILNAIHKGKKKA